MNVDKIEKLAERKAAKAQDGRIVIDGVAYLLTFDRREWVYAVTKEVTSEHVVRLNVKSLRAAKQEFVRWIPA